MPTKTKTRARKSPKKPAASRRCAEAMGSVSDSERLNWLAKTPAKLVFIYEEWGDETAIFWQVTDGKKSLSGHPSGDAREAIDAAMRRQNIPVSNSAGS